MLCGRTTTSGIKQLSKAPKAPPSWIVPKFNSVLNFSTTRRQNFSNFTLKQTRTHNGGYNMNMLPFLLAGIGVGLVLSQLDDDNQAEEENPRLAVLRRTFMRYASTEKDGDKLMTIEDLFNCISPHLSISKENLKILLSDIVDPVKGAITFQDFVEFDNLLSQPDAEYLIAFKVLDTDKDGLLSKEELIRVIEANQEPDSPPFNWNSDWVNLYFARSDHRLSYKEFTQLVKGIQLEKLKQEFIYYRNNEGLISPDQFTKIINHIKLETPPGMMNIDKLDKLAKYVHEGDNRAKNGISYSQVVAYTNMLLHIPSYGRVLSEAIRLTGKQQIDRDDFMRAIPRATTILITPMECDLIFLFLDLNGDGKLSLGEFHQFAKTLKLDESKLKESPTQTSGHSQQQKKSALEIAIETVQNFGMGAIGGGIGATAVYPIDLVKTRMQNQRGTLTKGVENLLYRNSFDCFRKVYLQEGFLGFYKGLGPQLVGVAPEKAIKLATNDLLKDLFQNEEKGDVYFPLEVLAGGGAGASQVIFTNPLEIVKIRLQVQGESLRKGLITERQSAMSIVKELGLAGLYKGSGACLLRDIPFSAIYFPCYAHLREHFKDVEGNIHWSQLLLAGAIAGIPAAGLVTPADVIKTRLQVKQRAGEVAYTGIVQCFQVVLRDEGPRAFFKGALARVFRSSPQFGVTLLAYELLQKYVFPNSKSRPLTNAPIDPSDVKAAFGDVEARVKRAERQWFSLFKGYNKDNNDRQ